LCITPGAVFLFFLVQHGTSGYDRLANVSAFDANAGANSRYDWYFDPRVAEIERKLLFEGGPGYVGHE